LNVGRERKADPKWLLPEICRQGEITKKEVGAIRVFDTETLFQVDAQVAEKFAALVSERKKGGVRILPAPDQTGESRGQSSAPRPPREEPDAGAQQPARDKPSFHQRKFGGEKSGPGKFGPGKFAPGKFKNKKKPGRPPHKSQEPSRS
jgi:ATP-dependent RNA helicase DeaD